MKKNTLYTANPWNIGGLQLEIGTKKNLYGLGAEMKKANTYLNDDKHSTLKGAILAASNVVGGLAGTGISDGFSTGAGAAIGTLGNAAGNIVGQFNPVAGAAINIGSSVLGGLTNRAFGVKTNEAALRAANEGTAALSGFRSNANSFDDIQGPQTFAPVQDAYKGGWFSGSKARKRNAELRRQRQDALSWAGRSVDNNIDNLINDQMDNALANYAAYGGPMDFGTGALGLMQQNRYFDSIDKRTEAIANRNMGSYGLGYYAFGGELGTNGTDFTNGLLYIDEGGTHESNPLEGVPMGMDAEGNPNLVEEGETVYNDYVFSNRIMVPESLQKDLGLGNVGKKGITFADASKKLAKESEQRPNDPISQDGLEASLSKLAAVQEAERMKQQMEEYATGLQEFACGGKIKHGLGGNLFAGGGALEWLEKNYPDHGNKEEVARWMTAYSKKHIPAYRAGKAGVSQKIDASEWRDIYSMIRGTDSWSPTLSSLYEAAGIKWDLRTEKGRKEHFDMLVRNGMDRKVAFGFAYPQGTSKSTKEYNANREKAYNELVKNYKEPKANTPEVTTTKNNPNNTTETRVVQQGSQATIRNANAANKAFREGIDQGLASINTQPVALAAPVTTSSGSSQAASAYTPASVYQGIEGINPYDWYRNGSDGYSTPTGFTVGNNGLIRPEDYTQEYRDLVSRLGADDIRKWAAEHPNDPSLLSFLARGNRLEDLTDDQWRRGATDGKYGFMHHVADQILQGQNNNAAQAAVTGEPADAGMSDRQRYYPQASDFQGASNGSYTDWLARAMQNPVEAFAAKEGGEDAEGAGDGAEGTKPKEYATWMRYAPVAGAGLMTLTDALGLTNRPDYSYADTLEAAASRAGYAPNITYEPIGDYMRYTPFDRLFFANQLQANARATDRALANTSSPSKAAGMIANGYNTTNALGNLYRQAEEYNLAQRQQVADFNRKTNMFNSQMGLEADMANARYRQSAAQMGLSGLAQAAALRDTIDQRVGAAKAANLNNLITSLGNIGRENFILNQINNDDAYRYGVDNKGRTPFKASKKNGGRLGKRKK